MAAKLRILVQTTTNRIRNTQYLEVFHIISYEYPQVPN